MPVKLSFSKTQQPDFYTTLNTRVEELFASDKLSKKGNGLMLFKVLFYSIGFISAYLIVVVTNPPVFIHLLLWAMLGLFCFYFI